MDKVLNRKMFRQKYLEVQKPQGFQSGGIADPSLTISDEEVDEKLGRKSTTSKVETPVETPAKTEDKDFATGVTSMFGLQDTPGGLTRNQKMVSYLAPIAAALLTGDQRAGESKVSGTLRALGLGMASLPETISKIGELDLEARKLGKEEADAAARGSLIQMSLEEALKEGVLKEGQVDPLDTGFVQVRVTKNDDGSLNKTLAEAPKILQKGQDIRQKFFGKTISDSDMTLMNTINQVESMIERYGGGDIPGIGPLDQFSRSDEAVNNKATIAALRNAIIKATSGAAVSESELKRLQDQLAANPLSDEQDIINFIYREKNILNGLFKGKLLSVPERAQTSFSEELERRFGVKRSRLEKYVPGYAKTSEEDKARADGIKTYDPEDM